MLTALNICCNMCVDSLILKCAAIIRPRKHKLSTSNFLKDKKVILNCWYPINDEIISGNILGLILWSWLFLWTTGQFYGGASGWKKHLCFSYL